MLDISTWNILFRENKGNMHVYMCDTKRWEPLPSLANSSLGRKRKDKLCQTKGTLRDDVRNRERVICVDILAGNRKTHLLKGLK